VPLHCSASGKLLISFLPKDRRERVIDTLPLRPYSERTITSRDVLRAGRVFVEYEPQTRIEGDIQQMPADFLVTDLWRVLTGSATGRENADQITIFDSVGFALEDYSTLRYVHAQAEALDLGIGVELVPWGEHDDDNDPKDLFRYTRTGRSRQAVRRIA
jgi:ornithine cyclodeaminase